MLRRSDVLALLRVAEDSARGRAKYDHAVSAHRASSKAPRFPVSAWRAKYLTQWPIGYAGWIWTGAGALSLDIVPPSIAPATLDATGKADTMDRMLDDGRTLCAQLLRHHIADATRMPEGWDGQPLVALNPGHGRPIKWIDARLRPLLTKLEWYASDDFAFVAGFDLCEPHELQALIMPVRV